MPCYLFTYHAYGSWMPDRKEGYVERHKGVQPPNLEKADAYRALMKEEEAVFQEPQQRVIIKSTTDAVTYIACEAHFVATESTHAHVVVSWKSERDREKVAKSLRNRITRDLKRLCWDRNWLVRDCSKQRVKDREHFEHLVNVYLPSHSGLKWNPERGIHN